MRYPYLWDDWRDRAACSSLPVEMFVPDTSGPTSGRIEKAKEVCASCPVSAECFLAALLEEDEYGIRGGTTPQERAA